jgi:hypothetical protein
LLPEFLALIASKATLVWVEVKVAFCLQSLAQLNASFSLNVVSVSILVATCTRCHGTTDSTGALHMALLRMSVKNGI